MSDTLTVTQEEKNRLGTLFPEQTIYKRLVSLSSSEVLTQWEPVSEPEPWLVETGKA